MEKAVIIAVVLVSVLLLIRRILRIIKEYNSFCLGCRNSNGGECICHKNRSIGSIGNE